MWWLLRRTLMNCMQELVPKILLNSTVIDSLLVSMETIFFISASQEICSKPGARNVGILKSIVTVQFVKLWPTKGVTSHYEFGTWPIDLCRAPDPDAKDAKIPVSQLPRCMKGKCGALIRPHVVWFGECLEEEVLEKTQKELDRCDLCLIVRNYLIDEQIMKILLLVISSIKQSFLP